MVDDLGAGVDTGVIAAQFHNGVVEALAGACTRARAETGLGVVALSRGVFQNVFHLAGHSFGAIVCAAALQGPRDSRGPLHPARPVHSLTLVRGALSLWSFVPVIPNTRRTGYFQSILENDLVTGPLVVTLSTHDRALGWFYRMAAAVGRDPSLAGRPLPVVRRGRQVRTRWSAGRLRD
jgi:hypothetical protein